MEETEIFIKMHELEKRINCKFNNIEWLANAMKSVQIGTGSCKKRLFSNETLAVVGDAVLKTLWAAYLYPDYKLGGELTIAKESFEENSILYTIVNKENLREFTYNDEGFYTSDHKILKSKEEKHDPYIEAIAGAIYFDGGFDQAKAWWENWLCPLVKKHKLR